MKIYTRNGLWIRLSRLLDKNFGDMFATLKNKVKMIMQTTIDGKSGVGDEGKEDGKLK